MFRRTSLCLFIGSSLMGLAVHSSGQELEQDPIVIKGDQNGPRTIYIAPWKKLGGTLEAEPLQAEFELDTRPLDREVFLRELELQRQDMNDSGAGADESSSAGIPPAENN